MPAESYTRIDRRSLALMSPSPQAMRALEDLQRAAFLDNPRLIQQVSDDAGAKQESSDKLTSLSGLDGTLGLVEQASVNGFTKRGIGVAAGTDIPTRDDTDSRYVAKGTGATWGAHGGTLDRTAYTAYAAAAISNPPTQAEVQAVANAVQLLSRQFAAVVTDLLSKGELP